MIRVSVIVPCYATGEEGLTRVVTSLDCQTLPKAEFEAIFVDDGSPDDTLRLLRELATSRPWMRVYSIPNSGWGSVPRNHGLDRARGNYVLFMDHDDSLYPDALLTAMEFADANDSDIISPKESKTNDSWWSMSSMTEGNQHNIKGGLGISFLIPLVPHKFYRRSLLDEFGIRFPEGARVLWEDQFFNIEAYRHAKIVSVLADSPTYLWHGSDTNSSHTFRPSRDDYWFWLERILEFTVRTMDLEENAADRDALIRHHVRYRVIDRTTRLLASRATPWQKDMAFGNAKRLYAEYATESVVAGLPLKHRIQGELLAAGRRDLMQLHHESDVARQASLTVREARWEGDTLLLAMSCRLTSTLRNPPAFRTVEGRVHLGVPAELAAFTGSDRWDITDDLDRLSVSVQVRDRDSHVSWSIPVTVGSVDVVEEEGGPVLVADAQARVHLPSVAMGKALPVGVWDLRWRQELVGMVRTGTVAYSGPTIPALIRGQAASVYANSKKNLSLDTAQSLRTVAIDSVPRSGSVGRVPRVRIPLSKAHVQSHTETAGHLFAVVRSPTETDRAAAASANPKRTGVSGVLQRMGLLRSHAQEVPALFPADLPLTEGIDLDSVLVGDGTSAYVLVRADLDAGHYIIYAERRGRLHRTKYALTVAESGDTTLSST